MTKILGALLGIFILIDVVMVVIFFGPKSATSPLLNLLPKNCKVVESKYCKTATIVGNETLNETVAALFTLPKGTKIYSPVNGQLNLQRSTDSEKLPYHAVKGTNGTTYYLLFEPETEPQPRPVKEGEIIGITTGKKYVFMKNNTLGVTTVRNQRFGKFEFDTLFR